MALKSELMMLEMVRASKEKRKIHTVRPIVPHPSGLYRGIVTESETESSVGCAVFRLADGTDEYYKPKYRPGDYMYFREAWCEFPKGNYHYKADAGTGEDKNFHQLTDIEWHPSIHMPRAAARIFYCVPRITIIRFEDVDEQFAQDDGFLPSYLNDDPNCEMIHPALYWFRIFWQTTYGSDATWMWVYWMEPVAMEAVL